MASCLTDIAPYPARSCEYHDLGHCRIGDRLNHFLRRRCRPMAPTETAREMHNRRPAGHDWRRGLDF